MKPFHLNDTIWDKATTREHRDEIIKLRDAALKNNDWNASVLLSVTAGLLFMLIEELEE